MSTGDYLRHLPRNRTLSSLVKGLKAEPNFTQTLLVWNLSVIALVAPLTHMELTRRAEYHSCMHRLALFLAAWGAVVTCARVSAQGPDLAALPPASDFHVTLQESAQTAIRWGPPCGRNGEEIVRCHMFTISVENGSMDTVRLDNSCRERMFSIWVKNQAPSEEWLRVGSFGYPCHKGSRAEGSPPPGLSLAAGEKFSFNGGFMSLRSGGRAPYTVRASVALHGCIELPGHVDCLSTLQAMPKTSGSAPEVHFQEPVTVVSNEIIVESPSVADLGEMRFGFQVDIDTAVPGDIGRRGVCTPQNAGHLDCTTFRYTIRNLGDRPVRNVVTDCNVGEGSLTADIVPEYRIPGGEWKTFPLRNGVCISKFAGDTAIPPGGTAEGAFILSTLDFGYSAKPLEAPGRYQLRCRFSPHACFASPDGGSCTTVLQHPPAVLSPELTVSVR